MEQDDIPMMDASSESNVTTNPSSSQRFSIVDVLGGDTNVSAAEETKEAIGPSPDPMHSVSK